MIRSFFTLILFPSCLVLSAQTKELSFVKADSSNWKTILLQAQEKSQPVFLDFYATWCGPCKAMDQDVFSKEEVIKFLDENYLTVKVDIDSPFGKRMKSLLNVNAYPTYVVITNDQQEIARRTGKSGATKFLRWVKSVKQEL